MGHRTEIHDKVLNAKSLEDISEAYGSWAKTYDQVLLENFGYQAPARSVELLSKYLPIEDAVVLDAGCGTGLVGQLLAKARKFQIDGADYFKRRTVSTNTSYQRDIGRNSINARR